MNAYSSSGQTVPTPSSQLATILKSGSSSFCGVLGRASVPPLLPPIRLPTRIQILHTLSWVSLAEVLSHLVSVVYLLVGARQQQTRPRKTSKKPSPKKLENRKPCTL